jgi:phosphoribosylformylglycinamidine synthase
MNAACAGGEPLALTDCLNFGNPEAESAGSRAGDRGALAASRWHPRRLGNVSLYNGGGAPIRRPVVGCVGLVRDLTGS